MQPFRFFPSRANSVLIPQGDNEICLSINRADNSPLFSQVNVYGIRGVRDNQAVELTE